MRSELSKSAAGGPLATTFTICVASGTGATGGGGGGLAASGRLTFLRSGLLAGRPGGGGGPRPAGARFGSLVHLILRDVDFSAASSAIERIARTHARLLNATEEEIELLRAIRFPGRWPSAMYYYRELQSLRDRLHFPTLQS